MSYIYASVIVSLVSIAYSTPFVTPTAAPNYIAASALQPAITPYPSPYGPTRTLQKKNIISDLGNLVTSALGKIGSDLPSYVASGMFSMLSKRYSDVQASPTSSNIFHRDLRWHLHWG
jgi:hypothetical protein